MKENKIKVLVIDDSAMIRQIIKKGLSVDPKIEVVATASDPYKARDKILKFRPDVLTLDINMPKMSGVEFLRKLMPQLPIPTVVVSSYSKKGAKITIEALNAGAVDFVSKPTASPNAIENMMIELRNKVKLASKTNVSHWKKKNMLSNETKILAEKYQNLKTKKDKIIVIGASTGGTEAIRSIITTFPSTMPPIIISQHIPPGFSTSFAEGLNRDSRLKVKEAEDRELIEPNKVLIAPGDFHMQVYGTKDFLKVLLNQDRKVNGHRPSVDIMMFSAAKYIGDRVIGIMLTGMGGDGAKGMKAMKDAGAVNFAQDEESCVVFGMPKVAYQLGGVDRLVSLLKIPELILKLVKE